MCSSDLPLTPGRALIDVKELALLKIILLVASGFAKGGSVPGGQAGDKYGRLPAPP